MNNEESTGPLPDRHDQEAAEWLAKRLRGFTGKEQDAFFAWLAEDPRNGEWFAIHTRSWKRLDALVQWRPEHSELPNDDLLQTQPKRVRWLRWIGGMAAVLALGIAAYQWSSIGRALSSQEQSASIIARQCERHMLVDGSRIDLNRGAAVKIDYNKSERRVDLVANEAHFDVRKDPSRPFVVVAKGVEIVAVGTSFNVRIDGGNVVVMVTEGVVRIGKELHAASSTRFRLGAATNQDEDVHQLLAGQVTVVSPVEDGLIAPIHESTQAEMDRLMDWRRQLEFDAVPLREVVAEFNRRNHIQIVIEDRRLESMPIVASFRSEDADQFVELLGLSLKIKARREDGRIVLFSPDSTTEAKGSPPR
jgi:transmembrane sensor